MTSFDCGGTAFLATAAPVHFSTFTLFSCFSLDFIEAGIILRFQSPSNPAALVGEDSSWKTLIVFWPLLEDFGLRCSVLSLSIPNLRRGAAGCVGCDRFSSN